MGKGSGDTPKGGCRRWFKRGGSDEGDKVKLRKNIIPKNLLWGKQKLAEVHCLCQEEGLKPRGKKTQRRKLISEGGNANNLAGINLVVSRPFQPRGEKKGELSGTIRGPGVERDRTRSPGKKTPTFLLRRIILLGGKRRAREGKGEKNRRLGRHRGERGLILGETLAWEEDRAVIVHRERGGEWTFSKKSRKQRNSKGATQERGQLSLYKRTFQRFLSEGGIRKSGKRITTKKSQKGRK